MTCASQIIGLYRSLLSDVERSRTYSLYLG